MRVISSVDFSIVEIDGKIMYRLNKGFTYHSKRYDKDVTLEEGYLSDGATDAMDITSLGWWVHDKLCDQGMWDDGTKLSNWQCSQVLQDIMEDEAPSGISTPGAGWKEWTAARWERYRPSSRYWQSKRWFWATWLCGGGQARKNGMLKVEAAA